MLSFVESIAGRLIELESPFVIVPLSCIPIVAGVMSFIKEKYLDEEIRCAQTMQDKILYLKQKNRFRKMLMIGRTVQLTVLIATAIIFTLPTLYFLSLFVYGSLIYYDLMVIQFHHRMIKTINIGQVLA